MDESKYCNPLDMQHHRYTSAMQQIITNLSISNLQKKSLIRAEYLFLLNVTSKQQMTISHGNNRMAYKDCG